MHCALQTDDDVQRECAGVICKGRLARPRGQGRGGGGHQLPGSEAGAVQGRGGGHQGAGGAGGRRFGQARGGGGRTAEWVH